MFTEQQSRCSALSRGAFGALSVWCAAPRRSHRGLSRRKGGLCLHCAAPRVSVLAVTPGSRRGADGATRSGVSASHTFVFHSLCSETFCPERSGQKRPFPSYAAKEGVIFPGKTSRARSVVETWATQCSEWPPGLLSVLDSPHTNLSWADPQIQYLSPKIISLFSPIALLQLLVPASL